MDPMFKPGATRESSSGKGVGDIKGSNMDLARALAYELSQLDPMAVGVAGWIARMGLNSEFTLPSGCTALVFWRRGIQSGFNALSSVRCWSPLHGH